jgi:nucleoid-associated protein YgaU
VVCQVLSGVVRLRILKPLAGSNASLVCVAVLATGTAGWLTGEHFADPAPRATAVYASESYIKTDGLQANSVRVAALDEPTRVSDTSTPLASAPSFSRIIIDKAGVSRIDGDGTPGSQVLIKSEGRVIGAAVVAENGRWAVALEKSLAAGDHRLASVAAGGDDVRQGEEVRVFIPTDFSGGEVVAYDRSTVNALPVTANPSTTEERAQDLANQANQRFTAVVPETTPPEPVAPSSDTPAIEAPAIADQLAQDPLGKSAHSEIELAQSEPSRESGTTTDETSPGPISDGIEAVRNWLKDASETYQRDVAGRLARPTGGAVVTSTDSPDEAARKIANARTRSTKAWEDAEAREAAEAAERERTASEDAKTRERADAEARAERDRQAQAVAERKAREAQQLEANMKKLEEAQAREAERQQAEQKKSEPPPAQTAEVKPEADKPGLVEQARKLFFQIDEGSVRDAPPPRAEDIEDDSDLLAEAKPNRDRTGDRSEDQPSATTSPRKLQFTVQPDRSERRADRGRVTSWRERSYDESPRAQRQSCGVKTKVRKGRKPQIYVVQDGETLWSIARRYYGSGLRYQKIYRVNRGRMPSPHVVRPCQRIILPGKRIHAVLLYPQA